MTSFHPMLSSSWLHSRMILLCCLVGLVGHVRAQETTGSLRGTVRDVDGEALAGVKIVLTQESTGATWGTLTQDDGHYSFSQLPPSYDYELRAGSLGYISFQRWNVQVELGAVKQLDFVLTPIDNVRDSVSIAVDLLMPRGWEKNAGASTISRLVLSRTPTLDRSLQDATRILPEANLNAFGGASYRFNNVSIDGSASNDVIGFQEPASGAAGSVASGTPGGLAGTQPIGYGAIGAVSVKTAPFDVTLGNFTGASLNIVTKQGGSTFHGDVYGFGRNRFLLGRYADGKVQPQAQFLDGQAGASLGGPLVKGRAFFFANAELAHRSEPVLNAPGSATSAIPAAVVQEIADTLRARYGYDPGQTSAAFNDRQSLKLLLRLDIRLAPNHSLVLRDNFVQGYADYLEWSPNFFNFGNQGYRHHSRSNSLVGELRSILGSHMVNKLILSHSLVRDHRSFDGDVFPHLEINYNTVNTIFAGTYREASIYGAQSNTYQFTDNLIVDLGRHTLTLGGSAEWNAIRYRFLTAWNGRWQYRSVQDFLDDRPNRIRGVYNVDNNDFDYNRTLPSAQYDVLLAGLYAQDAWRMHERLQVSLGLRADLQYLPQAFPKNAELADYAAFSAYENRVRATPQINPRVGFDYYLDADKRVLLHGGTGLFTGRMPFVWYAYEHYISGTRYFNIDLSPSGPTPITTNLADLAVQQPGITEINLIDNDFQLPRDWKSNLGFDWKLPHGWTLNGDATYSKVLNGLLFQSINRKDSIGQFAGADNRSYYLATGNAIKINPNYTNVFLLTNVHAGYRYNLRLTLSRKIGDYEGYLGYSYGVSKDISSTVRNSHAANFEWNQAVVANSPALAYSNFDLRHKIVSYHFYARAFGQNTFNIGALWTSRAGSPFTYVYEGDVNRDGSGKNDLLFIPASQSDIILADILDANGNVEVSAAQQWAQLDAYIAADRYLSQHRGEYAMRNGARTPWNHQLDLRLAWTRAVNKERHKLQVNFDLLNVANLVNRRWGAQTFVPNVQNSGYGLLNFVRITQQQPVFQFKAPSSTPWLADPIHSRWQGQLGILYAF